MRSLLALAVVLLAASAAHALPPYFKKFEDLYAGPASPPGFADKVTAAKCNVCHIPEMNKRMRNSYGDALHKAGLTKALAKEFTAKDPKAINAVEDAFKQGDGEMSPDKVNKYGDLFRSGKLHDK
jgi:hypothetical protein